MSTSLAKPLVVVLAMGRVSSSATFKAIEETGQAKVFHVHYLRPVQVIRQCLRLGPKGYPGNLGKSTAHAIEALELFISHPHRAKIVTLTRSPVERDVSQLFATIRREYRSDLNALNEACSDKDWVQSKWSNFKDRRSLNWFETEFNEPLDVNIFNCELDDTGCGVLKTEANDILLMKAESSNAHKSRALRSFLDIDAIEIENFNTHNRDQQTRESYRSFLRNLELEAEYVDAVSNSNYKKTFYPNDSISVPDPSKL